MRRTRLLTGLLVLALPAAAGAAPEEMLDGLDPGHYSVRVSGTVTAEAEGLVADREDARVSDDQLRAREVGERARYTGDTFHKPESGPNGPFEVSLALGPEYVTMDGAERPGLSIGLHFGEGIAPGTYEVTDGLIDVGPNAVPVAVYVSAASADRKQAYAFSWEVDGTLTLERIDREAVTGHFRFGANAMNRKGQVIDERVTAEGAFRAIPFVPEAELPGN